MYTAKNTLKEGGTEKTGGETELPFKWNLNIAMSL